MLEGGINSSTALLSIEDNPWETTDRLKKERMNNFIKENRKVKVYYFQSSFVLWFEEEEKEEANPISRNV